MDDRVAIPGNWLFDPLLRGRHVGHWVAIKREFASDNAIIALQKVLASGQDPMSHEPWWQNSQVMVDEYESYRKMYELMDGPTRERTAGDLERQIGLIRVSGPRVM